jgi:hypothetical protein
VDGGYYQSKDERKLLVFKVFCLLVIIVLGMEVVNDFRTDMAVGRYPEFCSKNTLKSSASPELMRAAELLYLGCISRPYLWYCKIYLISAVWYKVKMDCIRR